MKTIKIILIILISFFIMGIIIYKNQNSYTELLNENIFTESSTVNNSITSFNNTNYNTTTKIKVHVIGEIHSPGLYELNEGDRINDLISVAGGNTENADLNRINLAYELSDGEKIYIPSIFDDVTTYIYSDAGENIIQETTNNSKINIININKANIEDFERISGIGPNLAQKIIDYRNSNGKFNSIDELKNVNGIGDKKFEKIKEFVSVK